SERTYPELVANGYSHRSRGECLGVGLIDQFSDFQCVRIDLHNIRSLLALTSSQNQTIRSKPNVIDAESKGDGVALNRSLATRHPEKGLAAPRCDIQPFTIFGHLDTVRSGGFASRHLYPTLSSVPFPQLTIHVAGHHLRA